MSERALTLTLLGEEEGAHRVDKYKIWVLICDADDGEVRVVPRAHVRNYTDNVVYVGKWSIAMRGAKKDLRAMGRAAQPNEWRDEDGHYRYTAETRDELTLRRS